MEAKTLPAAVCVFGRFGRLSPAAVDSADNRFDSGVMWTHASSIVTYLRKNSFWLCWKQLQTTLWIVDALLFLIDYVQTRHPLWTQHTQYWIHCLLIFSSPLLSHTISIYDRPKRVCGVFWCFPKSTREFLIQTRTHIHIHIYIEN